MVMYFVGREKELKWLEEEYKKEGARFIVVYGRRRIGKTYLVSKFLEKKKGIYHLADESPPYEQIKEFSSIISNFTGIKVNFDSWMSAFDFITQWHKGNEKLVIVIDEFPYLVSSDPSVISKFQKIWDIFLHKRNIMLVLMGSSVSIMENEVMGERSPLYGRRTMQIELKAFNIEELKEFFKENIEDVILKYGMVDGIPAYADKIKGKRFPECLKEILSPNKYLYNEVPFLLKAEFRETGIYKEILYAIANGRNSFGEISQFSGIPSQKLPQYLRNVINARIVEKKYPITFKKEFRGAKYFLGDNYLTFWFRFIHPYRELIERGLEKNVYKEILKHYNTYMGRVFEKAILPIAEKFVPFNFSKIGQWWEKDTEIDLLAIDNQNKTFFGEIKWKENVDGVSIERRLLEKAEKVKWHNEKRQEYFAIFAKSFKRRPKEAIAFDLKDIEKKLKARRR